VITFDWSEVRGSGTLRLRGHGHGGADTVIAAAGLDSSLSSPSLDAVLDGGRSNDTLYLGVWDPSGSGRYEPLGAALEDGGGGTDLCLLVGDAPLGSVGCESGS
jgi:hypothetical protein